MIHFANRSVVAIGEAMVEMAPVEAGLYRKSYAGDTFNTVWHLARLLGKGAQAGYVTCVGQDRLSDVFVAESASDGLDVTAVFRHESRSMGLYLIELDGVERSFTYWRSASAAKTLADDPERLFAAIAGAGLIHLSGITLAILAPDARQTLFAALRRARAGGAIISFDPNIRARLWSGADEIRHTVAAMLTLTDIALPSFDDEATHWHDADPQATIARFAAAGVAEVVVKNGAGAVTCLIDGAVFDQPTPPVTLIRDTTGAGDAFNAGYLAARVMGRPAAQAIAAGQDLAAEVICTPGARAAKDRIKSYRP